MADRIIEYKCPNCGGSLEFDIHSQKVKCPYCDADFDVEDVKSFNEELSQEGTEENLSFEEHTKDYSEEELNSLNEYHCELCGGEIVCDANTSATNCPYCGSPVILKGRLKGALKPDFVIPFKKDKEDAKGALTEFIKKKLFAPSVFKDENRIEEIKGMYVPFWVYDADSAGSARFKGYTERHWTSGDYRYTEKKYYSILRKGDVSFEHIPVDGSKKMPDDLMESIEPFNFQEAKPFEAAYLTGHLSDKYDVPKEECQNRATTRVKQETVNMLRRTIHGYSGVDCVSSNIQLSNTKADYALYPVWILNTAWQDKKLSFAMNAQSGKMTGNVPVSKLKVFLWFLLFFLVGTAAFMGLSLLFTDGLLTTEAAIISIILGLVPAIIFCVYHYRKAKPVRMAQGASSYIKENSFHLRYARDIYLYKNVTRVKINRDKN